MRLGCFGCLGLILLVLVVAVAIAGVVFLSGNILEPPEVRPTGRVTRADGYSAQQKLYEVVLRQSGRSARQNPVVLTEPEVNAFLSNHLAESVGLPLNPLGVRFARGQIEVQGQTSLRNLLQGPPLAQLIPYLPERRLEQPVWVTVRGRIVIEPAPPSSTRGYGRVELREFALGKQPLGTWLLTLMLGSTGSRLFRWQVPAVVEEIQLEDGRAVIRTR